MVVFPKTPIPTIPTWSNILFSGRIQPIIFLYHLSKYQTMADSRSIHVNAAAVIMNACCSIVLK
jgi:hypothetical protein